MHGSSILAQKHIAWFQYQTCVVSFRGVIVK